MPSLRQIRYFLTVADHGYLTAAAGQLFVAQPALSRQIAQLEDELGFALFERNPRGVTLTAAGKLYRERVRTIERQFGAAAEEGAQLAHGHAGVLRLLHSSSIPIDSLLPAMRIFLAAAPSARIDLDRISSEGQIDEVAAGMGQGVEHAAEQIDDKAYDRTECLAEPFEKTFYMHNRFLMEERGVLAFGHYLPRGVPCQHRAFAHLRCGPIWR